VPPAPVLPPDPLWVEPPPDEEQAVIEKTASATATTWANQERLARFF
jgi:hypothetical protein